MIFPVGVFAARIVSNSLGISRAHCISFARLLSIVLLISFNFSLSIPPFLRGIILAR